MVGIRTIVKDWNPYFPILKSYTPSTLFMRADLLLIGLRFCSQGGESYTIHINWIPLWSDTDLKKRMPILDDEVKSNNNSYNFIFFSAHERTLPNAVELTLKQFGSFIRPTISMTEMFSYIDRKRKHIERFKCIKHNPIFYGDILTLKLALSTFFFFFFLINIVKDEIDKECSYWDEGHFFSCFNRTISQWKEDLYRRFDDREAFMERIRRNSELPKVAALNEAHIVYDLAPDSKFLRPTSQPGSIAGLLAKIFRRK